MEARDFEKGLTQNELKKILEYNPKTGLFTRLTSNNQHKSGEISGYVTPNGYILIQVKQNSYMAHRLAWLYITGEWPKDRIDHKNKIRSDNRWSNIRSASNGQNSANCKVRRTNFLGVKGVRLHECGKYTARICKNGKSYYLGLFDTIEQAVEAYATKAKELFGEFATHENRANIKVSSKNLPKWSQLFPDGRYIFYEGDDPKGFVKEIKEKFSFDIPLDLDDYKEFNSFGFHCPVEHLDEIYGGKYPMGS